MYDVKRVAGMTVKATAVTASAVPAMVLWSMWNVIQYEHIRQECYHRLQWQRLVLPNMRVL